MKKARIEEIKRKKKVLRDAAKELKKHFVGIDDVIDSIIKNIESWYCVPEIKNRPTVVNLFGLTGTGKTDLVNRLVSLLGLNEKIVRIDPSDSGHSLGEEIIGNGFSIVENEPFVILFDEFQNFRTISSEGKETSTGACRDFWRYVSDGKIEVENWFITCIQQRRAKYGYQKVEDREKELAKRISAMFSYDELTFMTRVLGLTEDYKVISNWSANKFFDIAEKIIDCKHFSTVRNFSKSLIFVCGNLDEAYTFAEETFDIDNDADKFYELSKKVNVIKIKDVLRYRFKPEQISRLGNTYIIYPALNKASYQEIIRRKSKIILGQFKKTVGIDVKVDNSIYDLIYKNGVFPTQGTRPVFSTTAEILENGISNISTVALINNKRNITMSYKKDYICFDIGGKIKKIKYKGAIDNLRRAEEKNINQKSSTAIHEAGHAVVYANLFGVCPTDIKINTISNYNGFVGIHSIDGSKDAIMKTIKTCLAGREAEEMVFGKNFVTWGNYSDLNTASRMASNLVRDYGMGKYHAKINVESGFATPLNTDVAGSNKDVEDIVEKCKEDTKGILNNNIPFMKELSKVLYKEGKLSPKDFQTLASKYGYSLDIKKEGTVNNCSFTNKFKNFLKSKSE